MRRRVARKLQRQYDAVLVGASKRPARRPPGVPPALDRRIRELVARALEPVRTMPYPVWVTAGPRRLLARETALPLALRPRWRDLANGCVAGESFGADMRSNVVVLGDAAPAEGATMRVMQAMTCDGYLRAFGARVVYLRHPFEPSGPAAVLLQPVINRSIVLAVGPFPLPALGRGDGAALPYGVFLRVGAELAVDVRNVGRWPASLTVAAAYERAQALPHGVRPAFRPFLDPINFGNLP